MPTYGCVIGKQDRDSIIRKQQGWPAALAGTVEYVYWTEQVLIEIQLNMYSNYQSWTAEDIVIAVGWGGGGGLN